MKNKKSIISKAIEWFEKTQMSSSESNLLDNLCFFGFCWQD